jgi:TolA-binding protein
MERRSTSAGIGSALILVFLAVVVAARVAGQVAGQSPEDLARSHYEIGMKFLESRQYSEALRDFQTVVDSFPSSRVAGDALLEVARYQFDVSHDLTAAQTTTDAIIRKYAATSAAAFAYVLNGRITVQKGRAQADIETATANFGRVPVLYPASAAEPSSIYYWGEALRVARRHDEALERYRDLALKYPTSIWSARALLGAAVCLVQSGRAISAMESLQRVRTLFAGTSEAATALNWNTILYRLYVRAPARAPYTFSGRMLGGATQRYKDISALAIDSHDNVFASEKTSVLVFDLRGEFVRAMPASDLSALFINQTGLPVMVRKSSLQAENAPVASLTVPQPGAQPRSIDEISAAVENSRGEWLISDRKAKSVLLFVGGKYVKSLSSGIEADRLALNALDDVALLDRENKTIVVADRDGKILRKVGPRGEGYVLENPVDIAFDAIGHLYVLDREKATVFVFSPDGKLLASFSIPEKTQGAFTRASALGLDAAARLYVFDERAQHVQIYQ